MKEYKLPEVLQDLITENNISQRKLADKIDVTQSAVHRWLQFKATPDIFHLMEIANYFDVSIDYLIFGEETSYQQVK